MARTAMFALAAAVATATTTGIQGSAQSVVHNDGTVASSPLCCAETNPNIAPQYQTCGGSRPVGLPFARRSPVLSLNGQVASAHPLASQAGLDILKAGGSAVDAAIATNAMLSFVEPMMNGPGGDLMAIVWSEKEQLLHGYNGAGRSSLSFSYDDMAAELQKFNTQYIPSQGPLAISVPGAVRGWCDLNARFGKLPLSQVLAPAIAAATAGVPVSQIIAYEWETITNSSYLTSNGAYPNAIDGWNQIFAGGGVEGKVFKNSALANTLQQIADGGCDAFYKSGPIQQALLGLATTAGLKFTAADLAAHQGEWVTPINTTYRERYRIFELPPNPQGAAALEMLNILEGFNLSAVTFNSADYLHAQVEAKKLAFADASFYFADPAFAAIPLDGIISKSYAATQRARINMSYAAQTDSPGSPPSAKAAPAAASSSSGAAFRGKVGSHKPSSSRLEDIYGGDTTYLTASDSEGNMVSLIQSLYTGFGSGIVSPTLGFALQSRGSLFTMNTSHANVYAPGKRPYHTIMPGFAFKDEQPWLSFGVMGGFMQVGAREGY